MNKKTFLSLLLSLAVAFTVTAPASAADAEPTPTGTPVYENRSEITEGLYYDNTILTKSNGKRAETFSLETTAGGPVYPIVFVGDVIDSYLTISEAIESAREQGLNVLGGINADFFYSSRSLPLGGVIGEGRYLTNVGEENLLAFDGDGAFFSPHPAVTMTLENQGGGENANAGKSVTVDQLNRVRMADSGIFLYDINYNGGSTGTNLDGWGVVFRILDGELTVSCQMDLVVEEVIPSGRNFTLDEDHMVLTAQANSAFPTAYESFSVGDRVTLRTVCSDQRLVGAKWATGCGDLLAVDGKLTDKDGWDQALTAVHPRTAFGIKPDGSVVAYVVDGRQSSYSNGALLENIASDLLARGCDSVVNLDGGGSSVMSVRLPGQEAPTVVNRPSSGNPRRCSTYILFVSDAKPDGRPENLHIREDGAYILEGASMPLTLAATDAAGCPAELPGDVQITCANGTFEDGIYTAAETGVDTVAIYSPSTGASGQGTIHVTDKVDTFTVTDSATGRAPVLTGLGDGAVIGLDLAATRHLRPVTVDPTLAEYELTEGMGEVTDGVLTLIRAGKYEGALTVSIGGRSTTLPISFDIPKGFSDTNGHWAEKSIAILHENGVVDGVGDDRFEPEGLMTRAAFVTMLWNLMDKPGTDIPCTYEDVPQNAWFYPQVAWSQAIGLTNGTGDKTFDPNGKLTREQGFTILYRLLHDLLRRELPAPDASALKEFHDASKVSDFALDAVRSLSAYGLIQGTNGMLMPGDIMTRAQMATLLVRTFY